MENARAKDEGRCPRERGALLDHLRAASGHRPRRQISRILLLGLVLDRERIAPLGDVHNREGNVDQFRLPRGQDRFHTERRQDILHDEIPTAHVDSHGGRVSEDHSRLRVAREQSLSPREGVRLLDDQSDGRDRGGRCQLRVGQIQRAVVRPSAGILQVSKQTKPTASSLRPTV